MVDDFHDLRFFNPVHRLGFLIMVYQNHPFLTHIQKTPSGNKPFEAAVPVKNREIPELLLRHRILDIIHIICHAEGHKRRLRHKMLYRDTLVNQPRYRISIMGRTDNHNTLLLGSLNQPF